MLIAAVYPIIMIWVRIPQVVLFVIGSVVIVLTRLQSVLLVLILSTGLQITIVYVMTAGLTLMIHPLASNVFILVKIVLAQLIIVLVVKLAQIELQVVNVCVNLITMKPELNVQNVINSVEFVSTQRVTV
jgi:hypothetical protein